MRFNCTSILVMLMVVEMARAETIHVPADYPNIYQAVAIAIDGDVIEVADGTYLGSYLSPQGKSITISGALKEDGTPAVILDGQQSGAVLWCYHGEDTATVFRNLILTNGSSYYGGGLSCYDGSSPALENCIFRDNMGTIEGGGVHLRENCNPTFSNCRFEDNFAMGPGGGMFCMESSNPTLTSCVFEGNDANSDGGGIYCRDSSPTLTNCTLMNNASSLGGGVYCINSNPAFWDCLIKLNTASFGSGIYCSGGGSNPTFADCTIENNTAEYYGGGIYCDYNAAPYLSQCTISNNAASSAGGLHCEGSSVPSLNACTISGNTAADIGGGIFCSTSSPIITDCTITSNVASGGDGGGIWCYYQSLPLISGTVLCDNSPDQILGSWSDGGANTIADECPVDCDGDITGDGHVGVDDLLMVIAAWGAPYDVNDVLTVIKNWGPCP